MGTTTLLLLVLGAAAGCGTDEPGAEDTPTSPTVESTSSTPSSATPSETTASPTTTAPPTTTDTTSEPGTPSATTEAPVDVTVAPTTYVEAQAHLDAARESGETAADRFSTPGDVVYCVLEHEFIAPSCELLLGAVKDPKVCGNAQSDFVGRVELTARGAFPQCNTDTIREPGAQVVRPNAVVTGGGIECAVEPIGVTCVDPATQSGFFLTQGKYTTF